MAKDLPTLAKITKPKLANVTKRQRLFERIDGGQTNALWLSGPAGSGKTTLVASYIDYRKLPCVWYQIDSGDSDVSTFFFYMSLAFKAITESSQELPLLTPEYSMGIPIFTRRFFEQFFDRIKKPAILIVDNLHEIGNERSIHEVILEMISVIPTGMQVIVLSRQAPPPLFTRLQVNNCLAVLGWPEIRFNIGELYEFITTYGELRYTDKQIEYIYRKTGGWAAGIQLMLKQVEHKGLKSQHIGLDTQEQVFDYFASEIFGKTDRVTQHFLMTISVLPSMTIPVVRSLTGLRPADVTLSRLNKENFFTDKLIGANPIYQFHPLFKEFLYSRVLTGWSESQISETKKKAAKLLEQEGLLEQALPLYLEVDDDKAAVGVILRKAPMLIKQGRHRTVEGWIKQIPNSYRKNNPWLLYWQAVSCMPFTPKESEKLFESAFCKFEVQGDTMGVFLALSGLLDAILLSLDKFASLDPWIQKTEIMCRKHPAFPSDDIEARLTSSMLSAITMRSSPYAEYRSWTCRALKALGKNTAPEYKILLIIPLVWKNLFNGDLRTAQDVIRQFRELAQELKASTYARIMLKDLETVYYWLSAEFDAFRNSLSCAINLESASGVYVMHVFLIGHAVAGHLSIGDMNIAGEYLKQIDQHSFPQGAYQRSYFHYLTAQYHYLKEEFTDAVYHSQQTLKYWNSGGSFQPIAQAEMINAICYYAVGDKEQGRKYLDDAIDSCRVHNANQILFECLLMLAKFNFDEGKENLALEELKNAMRIGRSNRYMNTWLWRPKEMAWLCLKALEAGIEVDYVTNLIRKRDLFFETPPLEVEKWPWPIKIYTLGRFALLCDGQPLTFKGKSQKKPLALLKAVIAFGGRDIDQLVIQDALWPDKDGDAAHNAFSTSVYRLRKLVNNEKFIQVTDGKISLHAKYCWVDVWLYEKQVNEARTIWKSGQKQQLDARAVPLTEQIMDNYRGLFLSGESDYWVISSRDRIRNNVVNCITSLGKYLQDEKDWNRAAQVFKKGIEIEPLAEGLYQDLICCYLHQGLVAESLLAYKQCLEVLSAEMGVEPSMKTKSLISNIHPQPEKR